MRINIYGPVSGPTGYDELTRNIIFGLYSCGHDITVDPFENWSPNVVDNPVRPLIDYLVSRKDHRPADVQFNVCLPTQAKIFGHCLNVLYSMFEADRIPNDWVNAANAME